MKKNFYFAFKRQDFVSPQHCYHDTVGCIQQELHLSTMLPVQLESP